MIDTLSINDCEVPCNVVVDCESKVVLRSLMTRFALLKSSISTRIDTFAPRRQILRTSESLGITFASPAEVEVVKETVPSGGSVRDVHNIMHDGPGPGPKLIGRVEPKVITPLREELVLA